MKPNILKGSAPLGIYRGRDGEGNDAELSYTIFPIIKLDENESISLIGTGFFISDNGLFLTAKHVLMDIIDNNGNQTDLIALIQFLGGSYGIRPILRCTSHDVADITVGVAAPMINNETQQPLKNQILRLTPKPHSVGSKVCTYAYPNSVFKKTEKQELHFYPGFFEGMVKEDYPNGRDKVLMPGPCVQTSMYIHGGASGGPVFNESGQVFGVNSTGYVDDALSFVTPVHTIESLLLSDVSTSNNSTGKIRVRELIEDGFIIYES